MYYNSVGRNSTLIVGLTPNPRGLLPEADAVRLKEWGAELRQRFSGPVASASGSGNEVTVDFRKAEEINHVIIMEDIAQGERVRAFTLKGKVKRKWLPLYQGTSIGHKHIVRFDSRKVSALRLSISKSEQVPQIKSIEAFNILK